MRIAWFSPFPPSTSGIAAYSAEVLPLLRPRYEAIDLFTDQAIGDDAPHLFNARDFVWMQRRNPYDLTVFQMGNAACHDYMWAYLFRYPGLVVLHDPQLHQARALALMRRLHPRRADYLAEFRANHPEAPSEIGELIAAGLGGSLYQHWPLIRLVMESARLTLVHNTRVRDGLRERYPGIAIDAIEMGIDDPLKKESRKEKDENKKEREKTKKEKTGRIVVAAFGGITPEKRIPQLIRAMRPVAVAHPEVHLTLVGPPATHYDVSADIRDSGFADRIHVTGYVDDSELPAYLAAADICACMRWPTNRETSASWLRCLAAGKPTIVTALAHSIDVPMIDAEGAEGNHTEARGARRKQVNDREPVAVRIDVLDEERVLPIVLERLVSDAQLRRQLGRAAREWWSAHHQLKQMAEAYGAIIERAVRRPAPSAPLPHLIADGSDELVRLAADPGLRQRLADLIS